jgi:class 3 adenylate cyclase/tetratricopeptide (TPR) repeat protein
MERKLATVLFVDLVGSTALVASADPEVVRRRVTRYFAEVTNCVEAHGGVVEKFAGDAVLAAFGVPQAHEDDAERAVKAAFAILDQVRELGLEARVGIESGEVVVDDGAQSTFVTGEAVNVAARLQQEAGAGEVLIGPVARGLSFQAIDADEVGPIELKGLRDAIPVWRAVCAGSGSRRSSSVRAPLIGRESELELLGNTFDRTVRDRRAHLFTIYGEAGVGKSRLAREFVDGLEGATVLVGRCLPYGEGITYWPLAEMVKTVAGISDDDPIEEAFQKLKDHCEDEAVADLLGLASGVLEALDGDRSPQEIAWAARAFVEKLAETQPVVLAFEDIHWAEEPLLQLVEHLADWVRAPLLILCLARAELLDVHAGWGGGRVRATAIELEALGRSESELLVEALLSDDTGELDPEVRRALLEKTEGNPLFVEETIRMMLERGDGSSVERIPDSLQALIGARIDRLPPKHRSLIRRAAVIGRVFWVGALEHLSPDVEDVGEAIDDLLLRDFLLPEARSSISGEVAFRFKHILIREVAFAGLSKAARADHHARFAGWLKEKAGDELIEIRAYHLDHAVTLLTELDGEAPADLTHEAAEALQAAGRRALAREANRSARKLLVRAVELEPTLLNRYRAALAARRTSDLPALQAEMELVARDAEEAGETRIYGLALVGLAEAALLRDADVLRAKDLAERGLEALDGADPAACFEAFAMLAHIAWWLAELEESERYWQQALDAARTAGLKHQESLATHELASLFRIQLELDRVLPLLERARELAEESGSIVARAKALHSWANLHYLRGELDEAEQVGEQARELLAEAGSSWWVARILLFLAHVARMKGDDVKAERQLRESIRILKPLEDRASLCESQRQLAEILLDRGKIDEAERFALEAIDTVGPLDRISVATTTMTLGLVRAAQGRDEEAERLLREAQIALQATGFKEIELFALESLVQFFRGRGLDEEAVVFERRLLELAPVAAIGSAFASRAERIA